MDLLHGVDEALKVMLSQLLLLDHGLLSRVLARDFASVLRDLLVELCEVLTVTLHDLVIVVGEVKVQGVCVDVWDVLDVVWGLADGINRLVLEIDFDLGHGSKVLLFWTDLQFGHCISNSLFWIKSRGTRRWCHGWIGSILLLCVALSSCCISGRTVWSRV